MIYTGMTEFRDALDHLSKAFYPKLDIEQEYSEDGSRLVIQENLTEAYEHLRRAGTESVERAANKEFNECMEFVRRPDIIYKLCFLSVPDNGKIRQLREQALCKIEAGRLHKSKKETWEESIKEFKDAIKCCKELKELFPNQNDIRFRVFGLVVGLVTIFSVLLNIYQYFKPAAWIMIVLLLLFIIVFIIINKYASKRIMSC